MRQFTSVGGTDYIGINPQRFPQSATYSSYSQAPGNPGTITQTDDYDGTAVSVGHMTG